jgi:uncharacterized glyoxalase superfamily protein PhnB
MPAWLPATANMLTPYLTVADADKALAFYARAFGFKAGEQAMKDDSGKTVHGELYYEGRSIAMVAPEGAWGSTDRTPRNAGLKLPLNFYVYCSDVDRLAANAKAAGATIEREPADQFWGDRTMVIVDPDGYQWMFAQKVGEFDPSKMPKPPQG